ncbi:UDP-N-acetylmuramoyl-tripeptide--D-alanyl-D-alanine ligase [Listeria sp. PSOL-1]|uniref:UDP-N-acetylmuramoyl-tripeptide--D-alanyl-D- alanine ligase n=1 Tax=Listeria sp. PSOL-1 TaxID=1844999 RepID=UPI0013D3482D|nr:UDP-N-acetylmuramoyl-tripeptide--D-alanyl-D-alanine ligase [Listeria sp. PSOL-1]
MQKTIAQIAKMIPVENDINAFSSVEITGICFDTRKLKQGDLFVPFVGETRDGHTFVKQAIEMGASASFWQKDVPNPPTDFPIILVEDTLRSLQWLAKKYIREVAPKVIAITGSNGKTTTKDITAAIMATKYRVHFTGGNFNNHIGLPYTILTMPEDTEVAVLEMGMSHRHEIEELSMIAAPDIAIITNIGEAHIEYLGTRDEIAKAKMEITMGLKADGLLVYPYEEPLLSNKVTNEYHKETFGKSHEATIYPLQINNQADGTSFTTNVAPEVEIFVPIIGEHNVFNTMAAMIPAFKLGITVDMVKQALKKMERSKNRLEWLTASNGLRILNDAYNSSPTALQTVLKTFMEMDSDGHKKVAVLGDMLELGKESANLHRASATVLQAGKLDQVYLYGDEMQAFAEIAETIIGRENVHHFMTKDDLKQALSQNLTGEEWLLVKASFGMGLKDVVEYLMTES